MEKEIEKGSKTQSFWTPVWPESCTVNLLLNNALISLQKKSVQN